MTVQYNDKHITAHNESSNLPCSHSEFISESFLLQGGICFLKETI